MIFKVYYIRPNNTKLLIHKTEDLEDAKAYVKKVREEHLDKRFLLIRCFPGEPRWVYSYLDREEKKKDDKS